MQHLPYIFISSQLVFQGDRGSQMGVLGEESRAYIVVDAPYALEDAKDGLVSILTRRAISLYRSCEPVAQNSDPDDGYTRA
jgi:hypothetical protein